MNKFRLAAFAAMVCFSTFSSVASAGYSATAHLTLQSQMGDYIGQGQTSDITYDTKQGATIFAQIRRTLGNGSPAEVDFILDQNNLLTNTYGLLFFGTDQLNIPIQPGTYNNAQRADFASPGHPGLDVSFQNRGSNNLTGSFVINAVSFFNDPTQSNTLSIASFSASFTQHSEGATPALFGTFTYQNSAAVPEPASLVMTAMGLAGLVGLARRRKPAPASA